MNAIGDNIQMVCGTVLLLAVLAALVILGLHGTVTGTQVVTALTTIIALSGGAFAVHAGVNAGAKAATESTEPKK